MTITRIQVTAGRTFNHPYEQFSNLRREVGLEASLAEGDNPIDSTKELQARAEGLVEDHKQGILKSLHELNQLHEHAAEVRGLQHELTKAQHRLDALRAEHPELKLLSEDAS